MGQIIIDFRQIRLQLPVLFQSSQHLTQCVRYFCLSRNSRSHLEQISVTTAFWEPAATISGSGFCGFGGGVWSTAWNDDDNGDRVMRPDMTSSSVRSRDVLLTWTSKHKEVNARAPPNRQVSEVQCPSWWCSSVVERLSLTGLLSLACT